MGVDSVRFDNCVSVPEFDGKWLSEFSTSLSVTGSTGYIDCVSIWEFARLIPASASATVDLELVSLLGCRTSFIVKFARLSAVCCEDESWIGLPLLAPKLGGYGISLLRNEFSLLRYSNALFAHGVTALCILGELLGCCALFPSAFDFSTLTAAIDIEATVETGERLLLIAKFAFSNFGVCPLFTGSHVLPCGVLVWFALLKSTPTNSTSSGVSNNAFLLDSGVRVQVTWRHWIQLL